MKIKDRQSCGEPWLSNLPKEDEFVKASREAIRAYAAVDKALHQLKASLHRNEQLLFETLSIYKHRYEIERQAAADYKRLYDLEMEKPKLSRGMTWTSSSSDSGKPKER